MKAIIQGILIAVLMMVFFSVILYSESKFDFRKVSWGMNRDKVKSTEKLNIIGENDKILVYKAVSLEKNVNIVYIFVNDKLVRAKYVINEEHTQKNDYIRDYKEFKDILIKIYNEPLNDNIIWLDDLYKNDPSKYGLAVSIGHLSYWSNWETERTKIICMLRGENYSIICGIEYSSKELEPLENKEIERKNIEDF